VQERGIAAARSPAGADPAAATPGLLDGYGYNQDVDYGNTSAALFGQLEWLPTGRLRILPGLRVNYDRKNVDFDQQVYGGLQTSDPALIALQLSVLAPQAYQADVDDTNVSGQLTIAYHVARAVNAYATYATGFKSVGLNMNGLPRCARPSGAVGRGRETGGHRNFGGDQDRASMASPRTSRPTTRSSTTFRRSDERQRRRPARFPANAKRSACEVSSSTRPPAEDRFTFYGAGAHRRHLRVARRAAAARVNRRTAGEGYFRSVRQISKWSFRPAAYGALRTLLGRFAAVCR
jgi:hypothetical protein